MVHDLIYTDPELLTKRDFTGTFVLWPFPNRVRDKRYTYHGQRYSLENVHRPGGYPTLIHGLVFDRPWHYTQPVIGPDAVSVTTYVDVNPDSPYYSAYPFDSRLSLTYTLSGTELTMTYQVHNKSTRMLPFGFAMHPYSLPLQTNTSTSQHSSTSCHGSRRCITTYRENI